jgi:pimeloyl-ACP methyl ester carboxylesterase
VGIFVLQISFLLFIGSCQSFVIQQEKWTYKGHPIGYEEASRWEEERRGKSNRKSHSRMREPVLLLNGFGVGSFHQHRLMRQLLEQEQVDRIIYGMDYLGQGRSWPEDCNDGLSESEQGLIYSGDTYVSLCLKKKKKCRQFGLLSYFSL